MAYARLWDNFPITSVHRALIGTFVTTSALTAQTYGDILTFGNRRAKGLSLLLYCFIRFLISLLNPIFASEPLGPRLCEEELGRKMV